MLLFISQRYEGGSLSDIKHILFIKGETLTNTVVLFDVFKKHKFTLKEYVTQFTIWIGS